MTPQNAYVEKCILTQPVKSGTATYCAIPNMDVAAKTGTTNGDLDRWLCGFTDYYTAACWYGYERSAEVHFSGNPAGKIWDAVMTAIHKDLEPAKFIEPEEGIVRHTVCRTSGRIATETCGENVYVEVFTEDNQPEGICEGHSNMRICNDTQMLATEYCPNVTEKYAYIPEKERDAIWTTEGVELNIPEGLCPIHGAPPAPTPPPVVEENTNTTGPSNVNKPSVEEDEENDNSEKPTTPGSGGDTTDTPGSGGDTTDTPESGGDTTDTPGSGGDTPPAPKPDTPAQSSEEN